LHFLNYTDVMQYVGIAHAGSDLEIIQKQINGRLEQSGGKHALSHLNTKKFDLMLNRYSICRPVARLIIMLKSRVRIVKLYKKNAIKR